MSLGIIEDQGRCPKTKAHVGRCVRISGHVGACRFADGDALILWKAIADLMGMLPVRYHTGDPSNVRTAASPASRTEETREPRCARCGLEEFHPDHKITNAVMFHRFIAPAVPGDAGEGTGR